VSALRGTVAGMSEQTTQTPAPGAVAAGGGGRASHRHLRDDTPFRVVSDFAPAGDQPRAIERITAAFEAGERAVTLLGATGTGKTFTAAKVLEQLQRPCLVIAPNKTLAAQLANEFRDFLPDNAVEYFVSYYDYYQPEAYIASSDTYIEKDSSINDEIDRLRHRATMALLSRRDVVVVASVSCIYGLGSPHEYEDHILWLRSGDDAVGLEGAMRKLVDLQYSRNDLNLVRGTFRVRGDTLEVFPADDERAVRVEFFGDEVDRIVRVDTLTGEVSQPVRDVGIFPASHYVSSRPALERAVVSIETELQERLADLERAGKLLEAQRLKMRTNYDLEMIREVGSCNGIENYSRHFDGRAPGESPYTLLDYFPSDFVVMTDESHVTIPQIGGMYEGDRSRKDNLIEYGFRLPSARDNRPLTFDEFLERVGQRLFISATPGAYERRESDTIAEQIIRPTGLVDPQVVLRPTTGQIDDLMEEIRQRVERDQRVLVTTLTKKMSEDLTDYLLENGVRVRYLHSDIDTVQRVEILKNLRLGEFDVLVGINLLREGLDLPEVSLVAILDADKEGFLRSATSLIQTIGRAARNVDGQVIMYADQVTDAMRTALEETERRRDKQLAYNAEHGIDPQTIRKRVGDIIAAVRAEEAGVDYQPTQAASPAAAAREAAEASELPQEDLAALIRRLEEEMHEAAGDLRFEYAARLRDEVADLKRELASMSAANV
jgi:excinuclease ABC subunit B